ncbi:metal-dependent hydrolase [Luteolibacter pohnpeiensis]|uniref:Metal-dependent hydrolase n=1 Tax=Luteolibacter pohnpeiensis TaxID=454153 RepID=A0A934VW24_9BACT|nr:metal-dependent hydrolase [Luteolibacter pohnpeiensis]MBK1882079.1 metal-dependent hydrolase [Luteolibacter pohnpeiensis]
MDIFTHALAPVLIARNTLGRRRPFSGKEFILIGIFGALPDILNPHLSLSARMHSWSHGLPCWAGITLLLLMVSRIPKIQVSLRVAAFMSFAYLLHMACDSISGGIDWLYPAGSFVWGDYWVDPTLWVPLDILLILIAYLQFRLLPMRRKLAAAKRKTAESNGTPLDRHQD